MSKRTELARIRAYICTLDPVEQDKLRRYYGGLTWAERLAKQQGRPLNSSAATDESEGLSDSMTLVKGK